MDQKRLYVDRNRNGDLTDDGRPTIFDSGWIDVGDIPGDDGKTVYLSPRISPRNYGGQDMFQLRFPIRDHYEQWVRQSPWGNSVEQAPIDWLDGPLQLGFLNNRDDQLPITRPKDIDLYRGEEVEQSVWIGTPNLGKDVMPSTINSRCSNADCNIKRPKTTDRPLLTIEFPSADPKAPRTVKEILLTGD